MRKTLSRLLAVALVGGAAALGLALDPTTITPSDAAAPSAVQPMLHGDFPSYPGVQELDIGRGLDINGQIVDMRQFFTNETPDVVGDYYEDVFAAADPERVTRYQVGNAQYVGTVNDRGRFLQVMIIEEGDGSSLVIPNVATGPLRPGTEAASLPVPLPESHRALMTFNSRDGAKRTVSAQFITDLDLVGLAEFYRGALSQLGFDQAPGAVAPSDLAENGVLRFRSADGRLVSIGAQGLEQGAGTLVHLLHEDASGGATP